MCDRDVAQHNLVWQYEEGTQQLRHLGVFGAAGGLLELMLCRDGAVSGGGRPRGVRARVQCQGRRAALGVPQGLTLLLTRAP